MEERERFGLMTLGHVFTQAVVRGLIFGIIAAGVYSVRLTTIPVSFDNWWTLVILFVLVYLGFYVEHRCSHRVRLLWASHSVHHSSERMLATTAFRLSWTPILSGVFLFYLPIVWIGFEPVWVYGMVSAYLDKNYGGVLLIWDHLFGSYQAERYDIPIRYGLAHPRSSPNNPFVIAYEELWLTLKAVLRTGTTHERFARLLGPP